MAKRPILTSWHRVFYRAKPQADGGAPESMVTPTRPCHAPRLDAALPPEGGGEQKNDPFARG
jgi:hypothetical protein